jgi:hypothetical protein
MTIAQNAAAFELALGKQASEGTAQTTAANLNAMPISSGNITPVQEVNPIVVTDANSYDNLAVYKAQESWTADITLPVFSATHGMFLQGLLPTDTYGTGTHTFTPAGTDAFYTLHTKRPGGPFYERYVDGLVEEITYTFNQGEIVLANVKAKGKTIVSGTSSYTASGTIVSGSTEKLATGEYMHSQGGTFMLDLAATPAATTITNVVSGSITLRRGTEFVHTADSLTPVFIQRGKWAADVALDLVWSSYGEYRNSFFGAATGTGASSTVAIGALDFKFPAYANAARYLQIKLPSVAFLLDAAPAPNADGSALTQSVNGMVTVPSSGSPMTVVLSNAYTGTF